MTSYSSALVTRRSSVRFGYPAPPEVSYREAGRHDREAVTVLRADETVRIRPPTQSLLHCRGATAQDSATAEQRPASNGWPLLFLIQSVTRKRSMNAAARCSKVATPGLHGKKLIQKSKKPIPRNWLNYLILMLGAPSQTRTGTPFGGGF